MTSTKRKRVLLTMNEKLQIVNRLEAGETITKLAKEFGIGVSTVGDMKRNAEKIKKFSVTLDKATTSDSAKSRKTMKTADDQELDNVLFRWFIQKRSEGVPLSGPMIKEKALILNSKLGGSEDFKASSGWLEKFKHRHGIRQLSIEGEKMSSNIAAGELFVGELRKIINDEKLTADQVYNCDETGLYWKALPTKTLAAANEASAPGRKMMKDRITILACSNASGSHRLKLALVGKSKNPRCFKNVNMEALPVHYFNQKSAWMNVDVFTQWFFDCFIPAVRKEQQKTNLNGAILLLDNAPAHPNIEVLKDGNIRCIFLPPNVTAILQPMDQGVLESMKRRYRKQLISKLLFEGDSDETNVVQFWKQLTIKDSVYMINEAWDSLPQCTIQRSWRKLAPYFDTETKTGEAAESVDDEGTSEFISLFAEIPGCENCSNDDVNMWLNSDANDPGFQMLSDEEIIAEAQSQINSESETDDEEVTQTTKITNSEAFECFSKGMIWLEQQKGVDTTELLLLKRLRDRAAKQRLSTMRQQKLMFKPIAK